MVTIVIATSADPRRVGLTFKIEMSDYMFDDWWQTTKSIQAAWRWENAQRGEASSYGDANTSVTIFREGKPVQAHLFQMPFADLQEALSRADYEYNETSGQPGRPQKKVLIATTSKERRTGSALSRGGY